MGDTRDTQSKSPPGADEGYHKPQRTTAALAVQGTRVVRKAAITFCVG